MIRSYLRAKVIIAFYIALTPVWPYLPMPIIRRLGRI